MGSLNKAMLIGNLGKDADVRYTPSGAAVATFSMATTETWNDKDGNKQERTEWHRIVLWGKAAESLSDYLVKGKQVYVEGRIQTRKWQDKEGMERTTTEIRADRITLLGGGERNRGGGERAAPGVGRRERAPQQRQDEAPEREAGADEQDDIQTRPLTDDDIPF